MQGEVLFYKGGFVRKTSGEGVDRERGVQTVRETRSAICHMERM